MLLRKRVRLLELSRHNTTGGFGKSAAPLNHKPPANETYLLA